MNSKNYMRVVLYLLAVLIINAFSLNPVVGQTRKSNIEKVLKEFSKDASLKNASWGFYAIDTHSGNEIIAHNPDLALIPASSQKMVTTITALSLLGSDYRFETLLQYDGKIEKGILKGNLYIKGTGDPTLGAEMMDDSLALDKVFSYWYDELIASGITSIEGSVIADGSYFDDHLIPSKWMWEDLGNYYGAGTHALTVHENLYSVFFQPGRREGEPASVLKTEPEIPGMLLTNDVTTGPRGSGDRVYIYGAPYSNERWLTGTVPLGVSNFEVKGSMPDPGHFIAAALTSYLQQNQIGISEEALTHRTAPKAMQERPRITLARWQSPKLEDIAARTNFNSVNTYAETLLKVLGKTKGEVGSFKAGAEVVTAFWNENGLDVQGMRMHDGSGLSPFNNITVRQLTEIMLFASYDDALYQSLLKGLPVAGESGSLSRMFINTSSAGVLVAKSGFLGNARAYTGYTRCRSGQQIAFTIIVNNYSGTPLQMRQKMEKVMNALTEMKL